MLTKAKEYFGTLTPAAKKKTVIFSAVVVFLAVITSLVVLGESSTTPSRPTNTKAKRDKKVNYDVFTGTDTKHLSNDAMAAKLKRLEEEVVQLRTARGNAVDPKEKRDVTPDIPPFAGGQDDVPAPRGGGPEQFLPKDMEPAADSGKPVVDTKDSELIEKIKRQQEAKRGAPNGSVTRSAEKPKKVVAPVVEEPEEDPLDAIARNSGPAGGGVVAGGTAPKSQGGGSRIMVFDEEGQARNGPSQPGTPGAAVPGGTQVGGRVAPKGKEKKEKPNLTLPAGSILSGTMVTGMDAPTSAHSRKDPFPSLLRIKHEAILPNRFRMDLKECFIIAAGYGDMASERAYLRSEAVSCVTQDGEIVESGLDAYAVGEDGKTGVRGRLVQKTGSIIGKALLSGFLSGITNSLKPAKIPAITLNPSGSIETQRPTPDQVIEESALGGISSAASEISKYYIDMSKNIFPVIEVDAGRSIDFIVTRSARLQTQQQKPKQGRQGGMGQNLNGMVDDAVNAGQNMLNNAKGVAGDVANQVGNSANRFFQNPISR